MPKVFADRNLVRESLVSAGRELFARYGLKRTSVQDITSKAGIAKGTFYAFFSSKEQLFFEIMEQEEQFREELLSRQYQEAETAREGIRTIISEGLRFVSENELLQQLFQEDTYAALMQKLTKEELNRHRKQDEADTRSFIELLQQQGLLIDRPPELITGVLRALFLLTLHQKEIGEQQFPAIMELLAELLADGLTTEKGKTP